jgi:stage V sporulation protein AD
VLSDKGEGPFVRKITTGKIVDLGIKDANNMGAAMAPAAADTILSYFKDTQTSFKDYDMVVTGDLGSLGHELLKEILEKNGYKDGNKLNDCGLLIYDLEKQDVHSGGSGCGCSASVLTAYLLPEIKKGRLNDILFIATGALMSPTTTQQGESIPGIAHLVHISSKKE